MRRSCSRESPSLSAEDKRLTEIMRSNGDRVRQIIENVMSMARRENSRPERLVLGDVARGLPRRILRHHADRPARGCRSPRCSATSRCRSIRRSCARSSGTCAKTRSSTASSDRRRRCHRAARRAPGLDRRRPFLEVADRGPGIAAAASRERIFEPFFTGNERGTGLGLFLARELAQTNGATLLYEPRTSGGSLFRIVFRDPRTLGGLTA